MKQYICIAITSVIMTCFLSCSGSTEDVEATEESVDVSVHLSTYNGLANLGDDKYDDLTAYLFTDNILAKEVPVAGNVLSLLVNKKKANKVFFVANSAQFKELASLTVGTSNVASFLSAKTETSTPDAGVKMFMATSLDINAADTKRNVDLVRGVARLDVSVANPDILVSAIRVKNTAKESLVLSGSLSKATTTYSKTYATPTSEAKTGVFYLYEHSGVKNCTVEIDALWEGRSFTAQATLPESLTRNTIYKVVGKGIGDALNFDINILPWGIGSVVDATPDSGEPILLDPATTELPVGVIADYNLSTITVPGTGGTFTFGLKSDFTIEVTPEGGASFIHITPVVGKKNCFQATVDPQPWNAEAYNVRYALKNTLLENVYDYLTVQVQDRPYDIPTVTLGGIEWMAFNTLGADGLAQTNVSAGQSIEEVYQTRFADAMGNYVHWGRPYVFKPWENTAPHIEGGDMWKEAIPCPPKFRVPSINDYKKIFPAGTSVPSTYTVGGKQFQVKSVTPITETTLPSSAKVYGRYLVIEEISTGHKLFLPFAGYKGDAQGGVGRDIGSSAWLWVIETHSTSGWAQTFQVLGGGTPRAAYASLQMNGFATLRCVKK